MLSTMNYSFRVANPRKINPYTYEFNNVVMSENGERPIFYNGYHQTDVIRAKA